MIACLYADGFRCLRDFAIRFSSPMSALIGEHGSGKSSVFDAIMLLQLLCWRSLEEIEASFPHLLQPSWGSRRKTIFLAAGFRSAERHEQYAWGVRLTKNRRNDWYVEKEIVRLKGNANEPMRQVARRQDAMLHVYNECTDEPNRLRVSGDQSCLRLIGNEAQRDYPILWNIRQQMEPLYPLALTPFYSRHAGRLPELAACLRKLHENRNMSEYVGRKIGDACPNIAGVRLHRHRLTGEIMLLPDNRCADRYDSAAVSDGLRRLFVLAAIALTPADNRLLLLEEPENGIFPRLLKTVIDWMRADPYRQIIMTTYSTDLMNLLRPEEAILLRARERLGPQAIPLSESETGMKLAKTGGIGDIVRSGDMEALAARSPSARPDGPPLGIRL